MEVILILLKFYIGIGSPQRFEFIPHGVRRPDGNPVRIPRTSGSIVVMPTPKIESTCGAGGNESVECNGIANDPRSDNEQKARANDRKRMGNPWRAAIRPD